jgi:hypothetical protein
MTAKLDRGSAPHSQPCSMVRLIGQYLLLLLIGALPALLTTIPAKAGACDNQTVSTSVRDQQLSAAVVINEVQANPYGERHTGSVCWSLDLIKAAGQPDKVVVHADVDIPDLAMKVAMDFSQNSDRSVSASHFVAMNFEQPRDVAGGEVVTVPGVMLKYSEHARGIPFAALATRITKGSFLVSLSSREDDRGRNLQLLKERSWFDIPMVYANQRRGILAVEKGHRGEQTFREAMAQWEQAR